MLNNIFTKKSRYQNQNQSQNKPDPVPKVEEQKTSENAGDKQDQPLEKKK